MQEDILASHEEEALFSEDLTWLSSSSVQKSG